MLGVFCVSAGVSVLLRHFIYPGLTQSGLLKPSYILMFLFLSFIFYRYAAFLGRYEWQLIGLHDGAAIMLNVAPIHGIAAHSPGVRQYYSRRFHIHDVERLRPERYPQPNGDAGLGLIYSGLPRALYFSFYVPSKQQLYRADFDLPYRVIEELAASRWLYPLFGKQNYAYLELLVSDVGEVALNVADAYESREVFRGMAAEITVDQLSHSEEISYKERVEGQALGVNGAAGIELHPLLKRRYRVHHELSGITERIINLSVLTLTGERYWFSKDDLEGQPPVRLNTLPRHLRYHTINAEENVLEWTYSYNMLGLINALIDNSVEEHLQSNIGIRYSYHLRFDEEERLRATNFEYIDDKKNEFEFEAELKYISNPLSVESR